jgi:hypothetical protein
VGFDTRRDRKKEEIMMPPDAERVKRGQVFEHASFWDPDWQPGPGQTFVGDAPPAVMVITATRRNLVYYRFVGGRGGKCSCTRGFFLEHVVRKWVNTEERSS